MAMRKLELRFANDEQADYFIGQLFDGICENEFDCTFVGKGRDVIKVKPIGDNWEHEQHMKRWLKEQAK